jgi:aryl-alcohol dehydrogenase-like predicted oxidoreductase
MRRVLGKSGIEVSALGVGTWAMGGQLWDGDQPRGWGPSDDAESGRALRRALELGVTLYDTADTYGAGHAEELLGTVFADVRDQVVIASKWGCLHDSATRRMLGEDGSPEYLRKEVEVSLRRLRTDRIDVYQLHLGGLEIGRALELRDVCEELLEEGKIRSYGWSTDDATRAAAFTGGSVVQAEMNVLEDRPDLYPVVEEHDLALLCRGPLAMGLLARSSWDDVTLPADDVRTSGAEWVRFFHDGKPTPEFLTKRAAVRDVLTSGGRTLAQGALAWIWARSGRAVPIPGCRTVAQVEENAGALSHGPLTPDQLAEAESILRPS